MPKTESEWRKAEAQCEKQRQEYEDEFLAKEREEFFASYRNAVQDAVNRRTVRKS